jgi:thioredoxin-like negative regulator of GroEL
MYAISRVKSDRTRSLLRGLLHKNLTEKQVRTYDHLRSTLSREDSEQVANLLVFSPLFSHLELHDDFPSLPKSAGVVHRPANQPLEYELRLQLARVRKHEEKLVVALRDLKSINASLFRGDALAAIENLKRFIVQYGYTNRDLISS